MNNRKKLIEIIKSGNFTVYFNDNGCCDVYHGKFSQTKIESEKFQEEPIFSSSLESYYTELEELLVEALGGKLHSV